MTIDEAVGILGLVDFPEYTFHAIVDGRGEMYLQASYHEADVHKPQEGAVEQLTRRWFISPFMTKSELVQTAFKCVITSMEHRVREHFEYRRQLVFGPHINVDDLHWLVSHSQPEHRK